MKVMGLQGPSRSSLPPDDTCVPGVSKERGVRRFVDEHTLTFSKINRACSHRARECKGQETEIHVGNENLEKDS